MLLSWLFCQRWCFFFAMLTLPWMNSWHGSQPSSIAGKHLKHQMPRKKWCPKKMEEIHFIIATIIRHENWESMFHWIKRMIRPLVQTWTQHPNPETRPGGHRAELRTGSTTQPWNHETGKTYFGKTFLATTSIFRWSVGLWRLNCEKSSPTVQRPYSCHPRDWNIYRSMKTIFFENNHSFMDR